MAHLLPDGACGSAQTSSPPNPPPVVFPPSPSLSLHHSLPHGFPLLSLSLRYSTSAPNRNRECQMPPRPHYRVSRGAPFSTKRRSFVMHFPERSTLLPTKHKGKHHCLRAGLLLSSHIYTQIRFSLTVFCSQAICRAQTTLKD